MEREVLSEGCDKRLPEQNKEPLSKCYMLKSGQQDSVNSPITHDESGEQKREEKPSVSENGLKYSQSLRTLLGKYNARQVGYATPKLQSERSHCADYRRGEPDVKPR